MKKALLLLLLALVPRSVPLSTWTVVVADPRTGDVGVAGASCVDTFVDGIAVLVPGKGAGVAQALWDHENRDKLFELLRAGQPVDAILRQLTDKAYDPGVQDRQYGIVTLKDGKASAEGFTGADAFNWAGSSQDSGRGLTVQGNILEGPDVVGNALKAFQAQASLPEALMSGLEAGSAAGGDQRCNNTRTRQTASAAFILMAHGGDAPYAAKDIGISDEGKTGAPWLALSVRETRFGANPVMALRKKFDAWKKAQAAETARASGTNY